jgi:putative MATE family efflux protein
MLFVHEKTIMEHQSEHEIDDTTTIEADGRRDAMLNGPEGRVLWRLAVPLALGFIINAVYSWTDMYFVSRLGDEAIAALGFAEQINFVIFTLGSGFCIGTGIVVARRIGENREHQASVVATQAMSFMIVYATLSSAVLFVLIPQLLPLLKLHGRVLDYTEVFMLTLLFGFPANLITFLASSTVRSTGNTVFPMAVLIIAALVNVVVDPILIFGAFGIPAMGVQGAAISTVLAQWVGAAISLYALYSGKLNIRLLRPTYRIDWSVIRKIFSVGVPSSLQTLAVSSSRVVMISFANSFGTAITAAFTIGLKVDILVFMPIFATGIAIETLVSQNIGAKHFDRVKRFRTAAVQQLGGVIALMGIAIYFLAGDIAGIFTTRPDVIEATINYLHVAVFGYVFFVVGQTATRSLSGAGHSFRSMSIVAVVLFGVQLPVAWGLSHYTTLGETGVFAAITISYLVLALVGTWALRGEGWMKKNV